MKNPFLDLKAPRLENPEGEECEGAFSCQERGCNKVAHEARYLREVKILTWKCDEGHISSIEGFEIE